MKDFFNYCRRYTKSRFFKFLLFFIVFCIISLVKSCDVHAWSEMSINTGESYVTYQIAELSRFGVSDLYTSRKFEMKYKQNGNNKPAYDFKNLTYYNVMNITFEYKLAATWNSNTAPYISFNFNNFITNDVKFQLFNSATTIEQASSWFNFYNFVPISAEYHDPTTDTWVSVDLRLYQVDGTYNTRADYINYIMVMPSGVSFDGLKLRFGDLHDLQVSEIYLNSKMYPSDNGSEPYMYYQYGYNYSYNTYKAFNEDDYDYLGLLIFPANTSLDNFNYRPSSNINTNNRQSRVSYNGSIPTNSFTLNKTWNFAGMDYIEYEEQIQQENQEKLDEVLEQIAQEEEMQKYNDSFANSMTSFANSPNSTAFTGLFSSLFVYPLQKLNETKNQDLFMTNSGGGYYSNLGLCTGTSTIDGLPNGRWRIHITDNDYFEMPCPHYDIYPKLHTDNYYFLGSINENINGTVTNPKTFQFYYQIVIRGLLVYFMFVTVLNIYKYILDINDTKVEVLEL